VAAIDTRGNLSPLSPVASVTVPTPPSAPTGLSAIALSTGRISLSWTAAGSGGLPIQNYHVYRGTSPANLSQMATVAVASWTDTSVSPGTTYCYAVAATDTGGDLSPMSGAATVTVPTPPSAPAGLSATALSASKIGLAWSAAISGGLPIQNYHVYRGTSLSNLSQLATVTQTSYTDKSPNSGATYYYAVTAADTGGDLSPMSAVATVAVPTPPSAPANLVATPTSTSRVSLTWSAAASGGLPVVGYQVFRGSSPSTLSQVTGAVQTSSTDNSLNPGSTYYYAVVAQDSGGDLSPMSVATKVTLPMPPSAPAGLGATPASANKVSLTWSAAASGGLPVAGYQVFRGSSPSNLSPVATPVQTSYMDGSLSPGATYYYAVEAEDTGGDYSPMSAVAAARVYMPPSAPASLAATPASSIPPGAAQTAYSVGLTWSGAASGGLPVAGYRVFRGSSPSNLSLLASTMQTACTDNSVSAATTYYYAVVAVDTAGDLSAMSTSVSATTSGAQNTGLFNILPMIINSFSPSSTVFPGLPQMTIGGVIYDETGYQSGVLLNGKVIYNPNQIGPGGTSWMGSIDNAVPMSVFVSYDATQLLAGFSVASNWTWFDVSTLPWYSKGTPQVGNTGANCISPTNNSTCLNIAAGYMGRSAYVGDIYYPTPDYHNGYTVFLSYDSSKALTDKTAYQTFVPPGYGTSMGITYGWCSSVTDGRFVYYAPLGSPVNGPSGNIFRYDTTQPFSNLTTGGVTTAWQNFDMKTGPGNRDGINANAAGFQSVAYDGYRYVYFIPFKNTLLVRYDTWNGGSAPDPTGFTIASNYTTFDPTQLGASGYPAVAGQGYAANLAGFTGSQVVWDAAGQNEYLYLVPWATFPNNAQNPTLQSTAARVRIGTMIGSAWSPVDITSTTASPSRATPDWEMYDLSLLMQNPAWPSTWPLFQNNPQLSTQSSIAGWQEAWVTTSDSSGATFPPRVGFVPDMSAFLVEHDVGQHLSDPTAWYVTLVPPPYSGATMGGAYDATNAILYPASPNNPLYAFQF